MAEIDQVRDFPGNPNPTPTPPQARAQPAPAAAPASSGGGGGGGGSVIKATEEEPASVLTPKATFRVVDNENGKRDIFSQTDDLETSYLGPASITGEAADALLNSRSTFDPMTRSWQVSEDVVKELKSGDLSFPDYIPAKYRANKAVIANGVIWSDWMAGKRTIEDARGLGDLETLKMQIKEAPMFVWEGDTLKSVAKMWEDAKEAGVSGIARRAVGELAGQTAFLTDSPMLAAAGLTAGAALVVSRGAAAGAVATGVAKVLEGGSGVIVFNRARQIEGGNAAAEMDEKGFDEATIKAYAPLVGVVNGALEVISFRLLAAPFKRVALQKVMGSEVVKKAMTSAYVNYVKELGGEISTEIAQERINILAETLAAESDARPDLAPKEGEGTSRTVNVALQALLGTGLMKAPGLALEAGVQRADSKAEVKAAAEMDKKLAARAEKAKTEGKAAPAAEEPTSPAPAAQDSVVKSPAQQLEELTGYHDEKKISDDEMVQQADKVISEAAPIGAEKGTGEMDATPRTFGEKVSEAERKARIEALKSDLKDNETLIDELAQVRERFVRVKKSTRLLDKKLDDLMGVNAEVRGDIEFYDKSVASRVGVAADETLAMKPATLESITAFSRAEGREEAGTIRPKQILEVAKKLGLTQADVRTLLKDRNFSTMGDVEFRHWMDGYQGAEGRVPGFKEKAAAHLKRKVAKNEVRATLKDRAIKGEANVRALNKLPSLNKMTTRQLWEYVDILESYDKGSVALTPKRIKANEGSKIEGARTAQDVLKMASASVRTTAEEMLKSSRGQFDMLRGDTELSESEPAYAFAVDEVQTEEALADAAFQAFERQNYKLGAKALASRSKLFTANRIVPSMPEVMENLEADPVQVYAGQITPPELTPDEEAYVNFLRPFFQSARAYLAKTGELETTRFEDMYAPHTRRSVDEVLKDIKNTGVRKAFGEFFDNWFAFQKELGSADTGGPALGLRKFFKQTIFRTGEMKPSRNVIAAVNSYAKQFYKKQALDRALPVVDGFVQALAAVDRDQSEEAQTAWKALGAMVKTYLNNKKGINSSLDAIAPRGGVVDASVRLIGGTISLAYIAGNLTLQVAAPVGETAALLPLIGNKGFALAQYRLLTPQGRKIVEKYEYFTGKGFLGAITEPGKNPSERVGVILYGLLQWGRARTMKLVLLSSMTETEFAAGEISAERLAQIKVHAGRWIDVPGMKSVVGSTSTGAAFTKFRGWYFPILRTTLQDVIALGHTIARGDPKKRLTPEQGWELFRIAEVTTIGAALFLSMGEPDKEDDSFAAQLQRRAISEMFSLTQVFKPSMLLTLGPVAAYIERLGKNITMTLMMEEYKEGSEKEGELKGPPALMKQVPFAALYRNVTKEKE